MNRIRRAGKRDKAEPEIIAELRRLGALVCQLDQPVDLLVGWAGKWYPVEVKSAADAPISKGQLKFFRECDAEGLPYFIFDHLDDTLTFITGPDVPIAERLI